MRDRRDDLGLRRQLTRKLWPAAPGIALVVGLAIPAADFAVRVVAPDGGQAFVTFGIAAVLGAVLSGLACAYPAHLARKMAHRAAELVADAHQRADHVRHVAELSHLVNVDVDLDHVFQHVTSAALELLRADLVRLWLSDAASGELRVVAWKTVDMTTPPAPAAVFPRGHGVVGWVVEHREKRYSASLEDEPLLANKDWAREGRYVSQITVPLLVGDRAVGALVVVTRTARRFTSEEQELLDIFAAKAASAVENARLFAESREQAKRLAALVDVGRELSQTLEPQRVFDTIVRVAADVFAAEAGLRLVEGDELVRVGATPGAMLAMPRERLRIGESISGRVAAQGEPVVIDDALADPGLIVAHHNHLPDAIRALLCVPIVRVGHVLGTLHIYRERGYRFDERAVALATAFADQAAIAIENSRLHAASIREADKLSSLLRASEALMGDLDLDVVLGRLLDEAGRMARTPHVKVFLRDPGRNVLRVGAWRGAPVPPGLEIPVGQSYWGRVAATGEPLFVADTQNDPDNRLAARDRELGIRTFLGLPIRAGDGVVGVLTFNTEAPRAWTGEELELLMSYANHAALAIESSRLHADALREADRLSSLLRVSQSLMGELDLDVVLGRVLDEAAAIAGTHHVKVLLVDERTRTLRVAAVHGTSATPSFEVPLGVGLSGIAAATGRPVISADVTTDPRNVLADGDRAKGLVGYLGLPVRAGHEVLGVLSFNTEAPRAWTDEEVALLTSFADAVALAVRGSRLYAAVAKRVTRLRTLTRLNQLVSSSLDLDRVLGEINAAVAEMMDAPVASFWLADEERRTLDAIAFSDDERGRDFPARHLRYGEGAVGWAAERRERVIVDDVFADGRFVALDWWRRHGLSSFVAIPVVLDGRLLAVLALSDTRPFTFDDEDADLLQTFVAQIAIAIRNARTYAASESRRREAEAVADVGGALARTRDPDAVARRVVEAIVELLHADLAGLHWLDPRTGNLTTLAAGGALARTIEGLGVVPKGSGLSTLVVAEGRAVASPDVREDPRIRFTPEQLAQIERGPYRACLGVPLIVQGAVVGVLTVGDRRAREFDADEIRLAQTFADQAALALESARLYRETQTALGELSAKNAELDSFVYSVSHDLKAPLVAMDGMASLLLEDYGPRLDGDAHYYLGRLQANVRQMERLINDLLALSRVGREPEGEDAVTLGEIVDGFAGEQAEALQARGVKLSVRDDVVLHGIRRQLEQVFGNLLGNAVKYLGDQPEPEIEVGAVRRDDAVECYVRDNGIGIDPAYHERVFEIFQRLQEVEAEGTGVGLAIVKKIVDGAGGRIWIESAPGAGATFRFTWPASRKGRHEHA